MSDANGAINSSSGDAAMFERALAALTLLAIMMLVAAFMISGAGMTVGWPGLPSFSSLLPSAPTDVSLPAVGGWTSNGGVVAGIVIGWSLRWVYCLPWAAMPRAFIGWLLGWRSSAMMFSLAVGCMAVLLLY
ncbi:MAG: hypothetical protein JSS20_01870 [Proteobacteria bacterium]|nr:hypothetical protein [Pseudomonadota bacterium]